MLSTYLNKIRTKLPQLDQLYSDLFAGGKGVRATIVRDISTHLKLPSKSIDFLCEIVENIHHSSLLHDDVIDASLIRRNKKAAWVQFSKKKAILAGDYLLAQTAFILSQYGNLKLVHLTSTTLRDMVKGEWLQQEVIGKENLKDLDQIHILKTSSLFEWCLKAPFLYQSSIGTELDYSLKKIGQIFGQLFQRSDDCIDFGFNNTENKKILQDLKEGYLNYFGVFLKTKSGLKNRSQLIHCSSREDLIKIFGEENLNTYFNQFNKMNQDLLNTGLMYVDSLKNYIDKENHSIIPVIKHWMKKLYTRK